MHEQINTATNTHPAHYVPPQQGHQRTVIGIAGYEGFAFTTQPPPSTNQAQALARQETGSLLGVAVVVGIVVCVCMERANNAVRFGAGKRMRKARAKIR